MKVEMWDLTADTVVVRLNRINHLKGLKDGPWKRICDYMIVSENADRIQVLFVELKKTLTEESKAFEQLRRSLPLMQYLRALCRIESGIDSRQPEVRYVLIAQRANPRLDKQRIRSTVTPVKKQHEGIEITLHIAGGTVKFEKLWHR